MSTELQFAIVSNNPEILAAKVVGGWLLVMAAATHNRVRLPGSMTFIPDPAHTQFTFTTTNTNNTPIDPPQSAAIVKYAKVFDEEAAIDFGLNLGVFKHRNHGRNAMNLFLKDMYNELRPVSAFDLVRAWKGELLRRGAAQSAVHSVADSDLLR